MVDGRFYYGMTLVKEGSAFLKGCEITRMLSIMGDPEKGISSAFLFVPKKWTAIVSRSGSSLSISNTYMFQQLYIVNW